jgi:hypothetical protein
VVVRQANPPPPLFVCPLAFREASFRRGSMATGEPAPQVERPVILRKCESTTPALAVTSYMPSGAGAHQQLVVGGTDTKVRVRSRLLKATDPHQ